MKAFLKNYRQSPRKVRIVGDLLKGKTVADALLHPNPLPKRAPGPLTKLPGSAPAPAKHAALPQENLFIENITVNKGIVLKRSMPRARGSASRINKRTSHVMLTLTEKGTEKKEKASKTEKAEKKTLTPKVKKVAKAKADK